eukprot:766099-Hanusia_phi.AAC.5
MRRWRGGDKPWQSGDEGACSFVPRHAIRWRKDKRAEEGRSSSSSSSVTHREEARWLYLPASSPEPFFAWSVDEETGTVVILAGCGHH